VVGGVAAAAAAETGLRPGTPVVVGSGDWFSTIVGSGWCLPERLCLYLGTAGIAGAFESPAERTRLGRTRYFGSVTATGSALRWARTLFADPDDDRGPDYARICAEAEASEPGARGLVFLPHLLGERGGEVRPYARGTLHGLTLAHRRADLFRAVLEGTALWLKATTAPRLATVGSADYLLLGGGARSPLWRRIVAAVYDRPLLVPDVLDGGALGVAKLAAVGTGLARDYDALAAWTRVAGVEEPDPGLVDRYAALTPHFRRVEAALRSLEEEPPSEE
jgi:xylulokinase